MQDPDRNDVAAALVRIPDLSAERLEKINQNIKLVEDELTRKGVMIEYTSPRLDAAAVLAWLSVEEERNSKARFRLCALMSNGSARPAIETPAGVRLSIERELVPFVNDLADYLKKQ